ncbi:MAG: ATP-dependent DNA helicase RecG [Burkholderiaceae bacterium]
MATRASTSRAGGRGPAKENSAHSASGKKKQDAKKKVTGPGVFSKLGIKRDVDLIVHLPSRYEDLTQLTMVGRLKKLAPGVQAQVQAQVVRCEVARAGRRSLLVELEQDGASVFLRFFHFYPSQLKQFSPGQLVRASGEVRGGLFGAEMVHPRYRLVTENTPLPDTLTPIYPAATGISQPQIQKAVREAFGQVTIAEYLPDKVLNQHELLPLDEALRCLHWPPVGIDVTEMHERSHPAWRRVILDELLAQQFALARARAKRQDQVAPRLKDLACAQRLIAVLPFALTRAQGRVWKEIATDLAGQQPMNRLLQGDVGSGKTVIAALAASVAVGSGYQAALMAPTEILARQHVQKLSPWLASVDIQIAFLVGSMKESQKKLVREQVASGQVDILIGTHALIEQGCEFERLGLSIVDEQHRFGVAQRLKLRSKSLAIDPHQLMMSATPIPRTLAMSYYADLDVSVIDELPPGRQAVQTRLLSESRREEVIARVRAAALEGRQVYWVCPLIEESEAIDLQTAIDTHRQLNEALSPVKAGLVHGKLSPLEKEETMKQFIAGELPVLVATTVIEVGVDVPHASLMVIENAERFGMAQLHQLRGRVGRGTEQSTCVLLYRNPLSDTARERLKALYETTDGFEIARRDLQIRGPGEFLGARQSGLPLLRYGDLERDVELLELARDLATRLHRDDQAAVAAMMDRWFGGREDFLKA